MPGILYIVATPIGNLEDITLRAIRVLQQVDLIAAEDTRHSLRLLQSLEIHKPLMSLHEHNEQKRVEEIYALLQEGKDIALISDAGTPCISDPGARLIQQLRQKPDSHICPVPGPSALITALSATGLTQGGFVFYGFLPVKGKERKAILSAIASQTQTVVLYESPHKLIKTLQDLQSCCQNPVITLARELTKVYEEFISDTAENLILRYTDTPPKGEFVLLISPGQTEQEPDLPYAQALMQQYLSQGIKHKQAAEQVASQTGLTKKQAYELGLQYLKK